MDDKRKLLLPLVPADEINADLAGRILNVHRLIANSPDLVNTSAPLRNYLVRGSALTDRQRELLILRTAHNLQSEYEWAHHVVRGQAAGLSAEDIERTRGELDDETWSSEELALLSLADEMFRDHRLSINTATIMVSALGNDGVVDAVFTVGYYLTLGTLLKTFDVPIDEFLTSA